MQNINATLIWALVVAAVGLLILGLTWMLGKSQNSGTYLGSNAKTTRVRPPRRFSGTFGRTADPEDDYENEGDEFQDEEAAPDNSTPLLWPKRESGGKTRIASISASARVNLTTPRGEEVILLPELQAGEYIAIGRDAQFIREAILEQSDAARCRGIIELSPRVLGEKAQTVACIHAALVCNTPGEYSLCLSRYADGHRNAIHLDDHSTPGCPRRVRHVSLSELEGKDVDVYFGDVCCRFSNPKAQDQPGTQKEQPSLFL